MPTGCWCRNSTGPNSAPAAAGRSEAAAVRGCRRGERRRPVLATIQAGRSTIGHGVRFPVEWCMAVLLSEIQWSDPVLPAAPDAAWEAELKRRGAPVLEVDRRVAASRWLREAAYQATNYMPAALPERL